MLQDDFGSCAARCLFSCSDNNKNKYLYEEKFIKLAFSFQVVDLLNQAALIPADEKLTVLKQVCNLFKLLFTFVNVNRKLFGLILMPIWLHICVIYCLFPKSKH